jgi:hypothetical protein
MMNGQQAHERAMKHGWNIIKFYGPGYDPTQGALQQQGSENLVAHDMRRGDLQRITNENSKMRRLGLRSEENRPLQRARRNLVESHERDNPGLHTRQSKRMKPTGADSDYQEADEEAGGPIRSKPREHESSFDTQGVATGSIFDQKPGWQGE